MGGLWTADHTFITLLFWHYWAAGSDGLKGNIFITRGCFSRERRRGRREEEEGVETAEEQGGSGRRNSGLMGFVADREDSGRKGRIGAGYTGIGEDEWLGREGT